jgi:hypothetical protein
MVLKRGRDDILVDPRKQAVGQSFGASPPHRLLEQAFLAEELARFHDAEHCLPAVWGRATKE